MQDAKSFDFTTDTGNVRSKYIANLPILRGRAIVRALQSKYKKCPASASVVCCDLLYFVVFFRIRYQLNAIKYIFRTFYHCNETKNTSFVETYFKNENCNICR